MKMMRVKMWSEESEAHPFVDWIPDHALADARQDAATAGLRFEVDGEITWREQLAAMENPEL